MMEFQMVLDMISENETARHIGELPHGSNNIKMSWNKKKQKRQKREDTRQAEFTFSSTQATEKNKDR